MVLSGDINVNPGFVNRHQMKDHKFNLFNSKGLHFIYFSVNPFAPGTPMGG